MDNRMRNTGWLHIGENLELQYLKLAEEHNLHRFLNKKTFRAADTPLTYRQVNSLAKDKILGENKDKPGSWREFSAKEMIYILIVTDLKKFGLSHSQLNILWQMFFNEPVGSTKKDKEFNSASPNFSVAETAIGCVFLEVEILLAISKEGDAAFYDPGNYASHDTLLMTLPPVHIRLRLNTYVNKMLEAMKKKPFNTSFSTSQEYINSRLIDLKPKELKLLEIIRNKDYEHIKIRKKNGDVAIVNAEGPDNDIDETGILSLLNRRDFQDIRIIKRNGKVVSLKVEEVYKL